MRRFQELTVAIGLRRELRLVFKKPPGQCASCTMRAGWNFRSACTGRAGVAVFGLLTFVD